MFMPSSLRCCTTQSIPAMTCDTSVDPAESATLTLTTRASGATPVNWWWLILRTGLETESSRPATIPAMWVPCP